MATNQTTNYQLNQWEPTDQVLRTDFNADNAKIDAALAGLAETDTALWAAVQKCRNCKIVRVPFTGNGFVQVNISFPQKPICFFILGNGGLFYGNMNGDFTTSFFYHSTFEQVTIETGTITWDGATAAVPIPSSAVNVFNPYGVACQAIAVYLTQED